MSNIISGTKKTGIENISFSLAAGTITMQDINGQSINSTNPVDIYLPNFSGVYIKYRISETFTFNDYTNATDSDFYTGAAGMTFGTTTGVAWGSARPLAIGFLHDGSTAYPSFSFNPKISSSGASTNIGYKDTPPATPSDSNVVAWTTTDITSTHANKFFIPLFGLTATKETINDWTLSIPSTGIVLNNVFGSQVYDMVTGQMGATSDKYFDDDGETSPTFTATNTYKYSTGTDGVIRTYFYFGNTAGGTAGSGSGNLKMAIPYKAAGIGSDLGSGTAVCTGSSSYVGSFVTTGASTSLVYFKYSTGTGVGTATKGLLNSAGRYVYGEYKYKAF